MKREILKLFILLTVLVTSCHKTTSIVQEKPLSGDTLLLVGKYNWTDSEHQYGWCDNDNYIEFIDTGTVSTNYSLEIKENRIVSFYRNDSLMKEKKMIFGYFDFTPPTSALFGFYLDDKVSSSLSGGAVGDSFQFNGHPFDEIPGCGLYKNYFTKE